LDRFQFPNFVRVFIPTMAASKPVRKLLFTPGPLSTTPSVRMAMTIDDLGSRDKDFTDLQVGGRKAQS
jgi:aspartate aminotransferase-like enzyme